MLRRFNENLLYRIRTCVATERGIPVWRLDDNAVLKLFNQMLSIGYHFRDLAEIEAAIEYTIATLRTHGSLQLYFEYAISFLDFSVPRNAGILYSGQYQIDDDLRRASSRPTSAPVPSSPEIIVDMESLANLHALRANKILIDFTSGGRWLYRWNLPSLVSAIGKDIIWSKASLKYVNVLCGEVDVFLAYPMQEKVFRSVEGRALLENPKIGKITYFVEHAVGQEWAGQELRSHRFQEFRKRFSKELVFRTAE
jgi:hypothetical protein